MQRCGKLREAVTFGKSLAHIGQARLGVGLEFLQNGACGRRHDLNPSP